MSKNNGSITFEGVVNALRDKKTDRIEASFASKLVATLDPTKPVIDKWVLRAFHLSRPYYRTSGCRESAMVELFYQLGEKYEKLLACSLGHMILDKFEAHYPCAPITNLKKIDLVLWQIRDKKTSPLAANQKDVGRSKAQFESP